MKNFLYGLLALFSLTVFLSISAVTPAQAESNLNCELKSNGQVVCSKPNYERQIVITKKVTPETASLSGTTAKAGKVVKTKSAANAKCGDEAVDVGGMTILIYNCGGDGNVTWVDNVPGQKQFMKYGIAFLQSSRANDGCLWGKKIRRGNANDTFEANPVRADIAVLSKHGVLRPTGQVVRKVSPGLNGWLAVGYELTPGACSAGFNGKTKAYSKAEILDLLATTRRP